MRFSKSVLIAAVSALMPLIGHADPIQSDPTLSVSNLTFNDFSCVVSKAGFSTGTCNNINVATITHPGTGIEFSDGFTAALAGFDDAVLHYHVNSTTGIDQVGLYFNGYFRGHAISSVTESVYNSNGTEVGFAQVACGSFGAGCTRTDNIALSGTYDDLYITKDINVTAFGGLSQISYIDQTFNATATPEPSSIALLGSGLLAAGAGLIRRRKAAVKA